MLLVVFRRLVGAERRVPDVWVVGADHVVEHLGHQLVDQVAAGTGAAYGRCSQYYNGQFNFECNAAELVKSTLFA